MEGDGGTRPSGPLGREGPGCRSNLLVFFREHDGQHAPVTFGVGRVGASHTPFRVVIIDLEHDRFAVDVERRAVVLLPRVVVVREGVEAPNGRGGFRDEVRALLDEAARQVRLAAEPVLRSSSFKSRMRSAGAIPEAAPSAPFSSTSAAVWLVMVFCAC